MQYIEKLFYIVLPFLLIGMYYGIATFEICLSFLLLRMITTDRHSVGFFLLVFGGTLGGWIRTFYPSIPIYGVLLNILGLWLMRDLYLSFMDEMKGNALSLLCVIMVFLFSYIFAQHTEYANTKIVKIVLNGVLLFYGYYVFNKSDKINIEHLSQLLIIYTIICVVATLSFYSIQRGSIFDYDWFRSACEKWAYLEGHDLGGGMISGYQIIGMNAAWAIALYFSQKRLSINVCVYYLLICGQLIMTSSSRQALLAAIFIVVLRFVYFNEAKTNFKKLLIISSAVLVLFGIYTFLLSYGSESVTKTFQSGDKGREFLYLSTINLIKENPWFGVGLGGFPLYIDAPYPHNILLEILCECGIISFILIGIIVINHFVKNYISIKHTSYNGSFVFLFLSALLVRVFVSGDLTVSIEIFSAFFAISTLEYTKLDEFLEI